MAWLWLFLAGCFEVVGAVGLERAPAVGGWWWPALLVSMGGSMGLLALAVRTLPLGPSYAIWTGMGTVGTMAVGVLWLGESMSPLRVLFVLVIVAGIVGLRVTAPT